MKKQVFKLMMLLALIVFVGSNAFAQNGDGQTPATAYFALEGASTTHTISLAGGVGNTTVWAVLIVSDDIDDVGEVGAAADAGTDYSILDGGANGDDHITVRWLRKCQVASSMFAVEVTETAETANGGCTTVRRSYVSVFGFEIEAYISTDNTGAGAEDDIRITGCNGWTGNVIDSVTAAEVAALDASMINNPTDNEVKLDSTFWRVNITLEAVGGLDLSDMKFRFYYTLKADSTANDDFYRLLSYDAARFGNEPGEAGASNDIIAGDDDETVDPAANNVVYVPAAAGGLTADYDFGMYSHIRLGSAPTTYAIRIDSAHVEFQAAVGGGWDNGLKIHTDLVGDYTDVPAQFTDAMTAQRIIWHGPATDNIVITD